MKPLNYSTFLTPESLIKSSDNFMVYFYLYRSKIKQRSLVRIGVDREKKLEDKSLLIQQLKAREVDYVNQIKRENSEFEEIKTHSHKFRLANEALEQEKFFLLQEMIALAERRPRKNSATFVSQQEAAESENEALRAVNAELQSEVDALRRRTTDLEDVEFKQAAEIKLVRRLLNRAVEERDDSAFQNPMDITMQTDALVKASNMQSENEE